MNYKNKTFRYVAICFLYGFVSVGVGFAAEDLSQQLSLTCILSHCADEHPFIWLLLTNNGSNTVVAVTDDLDRRNMTFSYQIDHQVISSNEFRDTMYMEEPTWSPVQRPVKNDKVKLASNETFGKRIIIAPDDGFMKAMCTSNSASILLRLHVESEHGSAQEVSLHCPAYRLVPSEATKP